MQVKKHNATDIFTGLSISQVYAKVFIMINVNALILCAKIIVQIKIFYD